MNSVTKDIVDTVALVGDWLLALLLDLMGDGGLWTFFSKCSRAVI